MIQTNGENFYQILRWCPGEILQIWSSWHETTLLNFDGKINCVVIPPVLKNNFLKLSQSVFCERKHHEIYHKMLAVKLETTNIPAKPPTKQSNQAQTSQTTHKPPTNQPNYPQTSHKHTIMSRKSVFLCYQKLQRQCKICAKFAS